MKAIITNVEYLKEFESKFGPLHSYKISYDKKVAYYNSKSKDQKKFIKGKEAEFDEEQKTNDKGLFYIIKPITAGHGGYNKQVKREQQKYSGFSASYSKDLLINGILKPEITKEDINHNNIVMLTLRKRSGELFEHMVKLDKTLIS